ncbi:hypothetical protein AAG906_016224 [Vitis piasezkii]
MASSTQKPSSSSSTSIRQYNFDVFLSFRGEDTRYNFTDHLFVNLHRMGIKTFRDDQLKRGEEIKLELLKTIEDSRISIVVFSKDYARSKWCLDELAKIMECREKMEQIVFPVFYHVEPTDVRNQTGSFGEAFSIHVRNVDAEKLQRWRDSLTDASNLSGFHVKNDGRWLEVLTVLSRSAIIITTRDQHLLVKYGVTKTYEATKLHYEEALQLFGQHAFKQNDPKEDYVDLSNCMVQYAQGLLWPLKF